MIHRAMAPAISGSTNERGVDYTLGIKDKRSIMTPEKHDEIVWEWAGETVRLGLDRRGQGPSVLLLPALSSISTRRELRPLQERLGRAICDNVRRLARIR
jgi:hypothetical protein